MIFSNDEIKNKHLNCELCKNCMIHVITGRVITSTIYECKKDKCEFELVNIDKEERLF